ncbi:MAG: DUF6519 domain-containing protein, partial [Proteobacteria bacterium]|nr:DUF6519 domain-containing protein [Pseudomonadota bacterium]
MKGDFTRSTFRPKRHYRSVRMQQGRVQLDADWNEQADILLHRLEKGMRDLIGPSGGSSDQAGFRIVSGGDGIAGNDFRILTGRYYVDGILCENDIETTLRSQEDREIAYANPADVIESTGWYLVYLDVWDRHITAIEDDKLRELALGGADTTSRYQTLWQVRCEPIGSADDVPDPGQLPPPGQRIRTTTGTLSVDTTKEQPDNYLYRVEVHESGVLNPGDDVSTTATFKWSRDNGAVVARVAENSGTGKEITVLGGARQFAANDWVEIVTEANDLEGYPGSIRNIVEINGNVIELNEPHGLTNSELTELSPVKIRRWDVDLQQEDAVAVQPIGSTPIKLENGIEIRFTPGEYKSGDYWYFPIRTNDLDGINSPQNMDAHGIEHGVAHLAVVHYDEATDTLLVDRDLRSRYVAPGEELGLVYGGGDGQVTPRGELLPEPLIVYVAGYLPTSAIKARFLMSGPGLLYANQTDANASQNGATTVTIVPEPDGRVRCYWRVEDDAEGLVPVVMADLIDENEDPVGNTLAFHAWLSNADRVRFYLNKRAQDAMLSNAEEATVQEAVDNLFNSAAILHRVGGDGQSGKPNTKLAEPLQVRIANGQWDQGVNGPRVIFKRIAGGGMLTAVGSAEEVDELEPDPDPDTGIFACEWRIGDSDSEVDPQVVEAYMYFSEDVATPVTRLGFTASVSQASEVAYGNGNNSSVATVAEGLDDLYEHATRLHYVEGDGQVAVRGEVLPHQLVVELSGYTPAASGKEVEFKIGDGVTSVGILYDGDPTDGGTPSGKTLTITTDTSGRAKCYWKPLDTESTGHPVDNADVVIPAVTATLVEDTSRVITFNAWLSNADRTRFALTNRARDAMISTAEQASVQEAVDQLFESAAILHYVGGDGQSARPNTKLAEPLQVRISNGQWDQGVNGPRVIFKRITGGGMLTAVGSAEEIDELEPDPDPDTGIFACEWRIGGSDSEVDPQVVEAYMYFSEDVTTPVTRLGFTASVSQASELAYSNNDHNSAVATVAQGLDDLYEQATRLHYVKGDGQVAVRGEVLPHQLVVELSGYTPAAGGKEVEFKIGDGATSVGILYDGDPTDGGTPSGKTLTITTDTSGRARCYWKPLDTESTDHPIDNADVVIPAVTATLVEDTSRVITFNAWLSNADRARFSLTSRAKEAMETGDEARSVQQGLDALFKNAAILHYVSGDGQSGRAGQPLDYSLQVRIGDGTWTGTPAPNVRFVADPGSGTLTTSIQTDPVT